MNAYRQTMVRYLDESHGMIQQLLSGADFEAAFPHVFGSPTKDSPEVSVRNECGLLLRKAQLHTIAVLRADANNNLHSMAVHMRVILECAAQLLFVAHAANEGPAKGLPRVLNVSEYHFQYAMSSLGQGAIGHQQIQEMIISAREGIGQHGTKPPRQVFLTDKVSVLNSGREWYEHLSECFCHSDASVLTGDSFHGGVMSITTEADELTFATFLDYLTEQVISMLLGNGFLLIAVTGETQPFDDALDLLDRKRSAAKSFQKADPSAK